MSVIVIEDFLSVGAGDALLEDGLFGGVGGELEGAAISGPGLVGAADLDEALQAAKTWPGCPVVEVRV
jgi:hypothetical protein